MNTLTNALTKDIPNADFKAGTILLINKPKEWTSFDVCNKVRYALKRLYNVKKIKVGHSGTLDPLATGLLQICTGKMTKRIDEMQGWDKTYEGTMLLGCTTPSYDGESQVDQTFPTDHITAELAGKARETFLGLIDQVPPIFSAIKKNGVPLYKLARRGETTEIKSRKITIHEFEINLDKFPTVGFKVKCSKGTYIRSLVHDFGKALDSGAYMTSLIRTEIGEHQIKDAWEIDTLIAEIEERREKGESEEISQI